MRYITPCLSPPTCIPPNPEDSGKPRARRCGVPGAVLAAARLHAPPGSPAPGPRQRARSAKGVGCGGRREGQGDAAWGARVAFPTSLMLAHTRALARARSSARACSSPRTATSSLLGARSLELACCLYDTQFLSLVRHPRLPACSHTHTYSNNRLHMLTC